MYKRQVPDDVGGRYSVLSAVGLLPIAAAGIDIDELMKGAADAIESTLRILPEMVFGSSSTNSMMRGYL